MNSVPVALLSQREFSFDVIGKVSGIETNYISYFEARGFKLIVVPNGTENIEFYFDNFHATHVILTGGNNISPHLYGGDESKSPGYSESRDKVEEELLTGAIKRKIPVLGICRGMQFINVFFGGKLLQSISEKGIAHSNDSKTHEIKLLDKEVLKKYGKEIVIANSYHDQGVTKENLAHELNIFALSRDGIIIEGLHHGKLPVAGVEWHPERVSSPRELDDYLMDCFKNRTLFWK